MAAIKGVMREELVNSLQMKKDYERELAKLPKGSLIKKKIKGHEYYYLLVREARKVKMQEMDAQRAQKVTPSDH